MPCFDCSETARPPRSAARAVDVDPLARDMELEVVLRQTTQVVALFVDDHGVKRDAVRAHV